MAEQTVDIDPVGQAVAVTPSEYRLRLRLKPARYRAAIEAVGAGNTAITETMARLDRVSRYIVRRLQRRYPALAVSRPAWSVDPRDTVIGQRFAYLSFGYIDLAPYTDKSTLIVLPDAHREMSFMPNRAQRRAAGRG